MRSIFEYLDYRDLLKDAFEDKKAASPLYSYRTGHQQHLQDHPEGRPSAGQMPVPGTRIPGPDRPFG